MQRDLFNFKEIIAVLLVTCIAHFWKRGATPGNDDLSTRQNWTVNQVAVLFVLLDVAVTSFYLLARFVGTSFLPYAYTSYLLFAVSLNIIGLGLFFSHVHQPLKVIGLSSGRWLSVILPGARFALVAVFINCLVMGLSVLVLPTSIESTLKNQNALYFQSDGSLRPIGLLLVEQACWILQAVIEEIKYRGLLYGALRRQMAPFPVRVLTATAFMMSHSWINPLAFVIGWLTASLREKHQSLIPAIVFHLGWNIALDAGGLIMRGLGVEPRVYFFSAAVLSGIAYVIAYVCSRSEKLDFPGFNGHL